MKSLWVQIAKTIVEQTTAALLLDINPIDLARGKLGARDGGLFDYVNDRPYVASSFIEQILFERLNLLKRRYLKRLQGAFRMLMDYLMKLGLFFLKEGLTLKN